MNPLLKLLTAFFSFVLLNACTSGTADPKVAAKSFFDAFAGKDYDLAAKFATKDSKTLLDLVKSMDQLGSPLNISKSGTDEEKIKEAIYEDAMVEGEKATVRVTLGNETHTIKLIMEDGAWKVALDKETLKETVAEESGSSVDEINASVDEAMKGFENLQSDSLDPAIDEAAKEVENDSTGKFLKKAADTTKAATKKNQ